MSADRAAEHRAHRRRVEPVDSDDDDEPRRFARLTARQLRRALESLLRLLCDADDARFFLHPVDPVRDGAPDYYEVVEHPMDFTKIRAKLREGVYHGASAFFADVRLVFANAMLYNAEPEHSVHVAALRLKATVEQYLGDAPSDDEGDDSGDSSDGSVRRRLRAPREPRSSATEWPQGPYAAARK